MLTKLPVAALALSTVIAQPFTPEMLVQTTRFSGSAAISPSSHAVAYVQTRYSIEDKRQATQLVIHHISNTADTEIVMDHSADARPNPPPSASSTASEKSDESDGNAESNGKRVLKPSQPVWLSDSILGFVATENGRSTVYAMTAHGHKGKRWSKPHALMTLPVAISNLQYSEQAGALVFTAEVYNGTTLEQTAQKDLEELERADTGQTYDSLWVRHWDEFTSPKMSQIHVLRVSKVKSDVVEVKPAKHAQNIIRDTATAGGRFETSDFVLAPDGKSVVFVAKNPSGEYAWTTTSYVYLADLDGSAATAINADKSAGASDSPAFSQDGSRLVYLQMDSPTYEADRNRILIYDISNKTTVEVASDWDRSPSSVEWADDSTLLVVYPEWGRSKLAKIDIASGTVTVVINEHSVGYIKRLSTQDDRWLVSYSGFSYPTDLHVLSLESASLERLTELNPDLSPATLPAAQDLVFAGSNNSTIHGFIIHPPGFDSNSTYPLAFVIHGGPQSSFSDAWSTRWNLQVLASAGFVTVALDVEGSTGYGQEFTDAIRNQWGGRPYESLMFSLNQLLDQHPYIDRQRLAALGASYGGYMINWINGHTDIFRALVNHDGMFSTIGTYYSTEELYFPETEFEGTPFDPVARRNYERWSPERFVAEWKTPTLVIHSEKDYRLGVAEGLSTFTALRRRGVPARLLYFPDENHWVLKPANSLRWHHEVLSWITQWTAKEHKNQTVPADKQSVNHNSNKLVIQNEEL